jgi:AcrR family transcriptional regulator
MARKASTAPRKLPRQERAQFTVDAILTATKKVLAGEGRERATTNRIAEVAGVSIGSLYQYFPNKDTLIEIVRAGQEGAFRAKLEPRFERMVDLPLREAVRGVVSLLIEYHRESRGIHNALQEPAQPEFHEDLMERWLGTTIAYLEAHREEIRPTNLPLAARMALETVESLTHDMSMRSPELLDDPEYASELVEMLVGYLERRPSHR